MSIVYILKNQSDCYLDRHAEWVGPEDAKALFRTPYKDEALNRSVELSVKHADVRITIVEATLGERGELQLPSVPSESPANEPVIHPEDTPPHQAFL